MWFKLSVKESDPKVVSDAIGEITKLVCDNKKYTSEMYMNPTEQVLYFTTTHALKDEVEKAGFLQADVTDGGKISLLTLVKMWDEKSIDNL